MRKGRKYFLKKKIGTTQTFEKAKERESERKREREKVEQSNCECERLKIEN